jgi:ABC-2 type transport system permease protein
VSVLAKYRYVFLTGLQSSLVYRWNFAARSAFSLVHLSFVFILWGAAYRGQTDIGGFNLAQTLTYFLAMLVIQFFISAQNEDYQIGEDIRNGMINQFLLKPIDYYAYRLTLFFSARLVTGCLALLPIPLVEVAKLFRAGAAPRAAGELCHHGAVTAAGACRACAARRWVR